jgi:hypothetical protein
MLYPDNTDLLEIHRWDLTLTLKNNPHLSNGFEGDIYIPHTLHMCVSNT